MAGFPFGTPFYIWTPFKENLLHVYVTLNMYYLISQRDAGWFESSIALVRM